MLTTVDEVLDFIKDNDVKFIRLSFCDLLGRQKNISVMPDELPRAFEHGIPFDAHAISGFNDITKSDLLLVPDPTTLSVLPWRPQQGRVVRFYCSIKNPDGSVFWGDTREILKSVVNKFSQKGYTCMIGAECEFYLFKTDENGEPTTKPFDNGGYLDVSPLDKGENVRREICLCLEEMGIRPETSHHEQGPGQNEIDFKFSDAVNSADNLITFKQVVRSIAARNGLFASFAPKPLPGKSGSGLHINISLMKNGQNIFRLGEKEDSKIPESFVAGVLQKITEITAFLNPIPNSYERLGYFEAPKYVSWSYGNRSQLVRIPAAQKDRRRMELRSPDPATNPYLAFALVIGAGMYGIENNLELPESINVDLYSADESITGKLPRLPENLEEALRLAEKSDLVRSILNERVIERFVELKTKELKEYDRAEDKYGHFIENYFRVI
ncbi:glutamine synthetase family protein [Thermoclostridium stercorarium]|jgi:glutamine synthetase|nr:glutamine synthetase family protein [Thermoclostridium stercorarium]AGI39766.1 L-glutamine synthetase [Thermoclostridium stercorarium subsp. stercorarium DSM 8532]UZQ84729.1 glutamine synthetase family protein [Thermoclostridium stercorarium]